MLYICPVHTLLNLAEEANTSEASQDPEGELMSYQLDGDFQAKPSADDDNHINRKIDAQASSSRSDISKPSSSAVSWESERADFFKTSCHAALPSCDVASFSWLVLARSMHLISLQVLWEGTW